MAVSRYSGASTRKRPPEGASVWGRPRRLVGYCNSTRRVPSGVFTASMIVPAIMTTLPTYASGFDASWAYESSGSVRLCTCGEITEPQATQPSRLASTISQCHRIASSFSADGLPQSLSEATEGIGSPPVWTVPGPPVVIVIQRTSIGHGRPEVDLQAGKEGIDVRNFPNRVCPRAQNTPSQSHLASFAIDCRVEIPLTKRHEAPFGLIRSKRSVRSIQWFLQHFEKRTLGEITGAHNIPT